MVVGLVGSSYGIHGWLRIFSFTEKASNIFSYHPWFIKRSGKWVPIRVENWKQHHHNLLIKVRGIENPQTATLLTNCEIVVDATQFPDPGKDVYYWKDLLGSQVITISSYQMGEVVDLFATGSNDILVVKANLKDVFGIQERLIPFLEGKVIQTVDLKAHIIAVDWDPNF
ncbi:16S rRNA processing protein RimM [secondary endosymbiont of Ctenarytaina eucalypti]|uniref:Ribosome maturation factor RimM n=2 Tax=secondary endosymbiont of Ctenarytaina eucalypti TaxID=1199245 RepID=J3TFY8_9ENTR|nr:16S rRNA processing protein RimM [secondary endosymbiont of Ctenarytaina eucalypti]